MSPPPADPPTVREQLRRRGLRPKKGLGQNFLADRKIAELIAREATPDPGQAHVVEIGAGTGALTHHLLGRAASVVAVERDAALVPVLEEDFASSLAEGRLRIEHSDAREVDLAAALGRVPPRVLTGNLPYAITGPMLSATTRLTASLERAVFLVQLEVAARLTARPGTKEYGALSVFVQAAFEPRRARTVKRGSFFPVPKVDSAVVVLEPLTQPRAEETKTFVELVHRAFQQRRKKLRNAWRGVGGLEDTELARAAERARVSLELRGEALSVERFASMANEVQCTAG